MNRTLLALLLAVLTVVFLRLLVEGDIGNAAVILAASWPFVQRLYDENQGFIENVNEDDKQ